MEKIRIHEMGWLNPPARHEETEEGILIVTEGGTDFWQRTYYGFRNDNAPVCYFEREGDFTFSVRTEFDSRALFDQCGIILYRDSDNWCKASIEYEAPRVSKLGSVVTNLGYSDWATTDLDASRGVMWYRLSRRGQDFLIENSPDGETFAQMRIFHIHEPLAAARVGIYACSPLESSFTARFSHLSISECLWKKHEL